MWKFNRFTLLREIKEGLKLFISMNLNIENSICLQNRLNRLAGKSLSQKLIQELLSI